MNTIYSVSPERFKVMTTNELRNSFLVDSIFNDGKLDLAYWENDRTVIGSAVPTEDILELHVAEEIASEYFCERREVGIFNIGGLGTISVDGEQYDMANRDCLYIGRGSKDILFASEQSATPAKYYILSFPAHTSYPTQQAKKDDLSPLQLGDQIHSNERKIYKYIYPNGGIESCQLVMGYTELESGCIWNTMPCHTHARRTESYLYFDMQEDRPLFHFMGPPNETRHLVIHNEQLALSPMWSIHSGAGTGTYAFIWGMGGENQCFDDMDHINMKDLK